LRKPHQSGTPVVRPAVGSAGGPTMVVSPFAAPETESRLREDLPCGEAGLCAFVQRGHCESL